MVIEPDTPLFDADHVGSFIVEDMEKKPHQPAITIDAQIENLKALKLKIEDEEAAKAVLGEVAYFRLVKAYSLGLKPRNEAYYEGMSFERLVQLYQFNTEFRHLLTPLFERIEVMFRCRLGNYFSLQYGVLGYLQHRNFRSPQRHDLFLKDLEKEIVRNGRSPFVRNFRSNYEGGRIPFYALTEIMSFGTMSKFYKNMLGADKKRLAEMYGVDYTYLESWLESIAYVRNICAHYGRLYNAKLTKRPMLYTQDKEAGIPNRRVFSVLCCMRFLLPLDEQWAEFLDALEGLFEKYPCVVLEAIGFEKGWRGVLEGR